SFSDGSTMSGYPNNANMLPKLLAPYKKYGSFADGWPVPANQRCSSGLLAEMTKNGSPTATPNSASSQRTGLLSVGGVQPLGRWMGRAIKGRSSSSEWRMT